MVIRAGRKGTCSMREGTRTMYKFVAGKLEMEKNKRKKDKEKEMERSRRRSEST
jgi:hypothetical protein